MIKIMIKKKKNLRIYNKLNYKENKYILKISNKSN